MVWVYLLLIEESQMEQMVLMELMVVMVPMELIVLMELVVLMALLVLMEQTEQDLQEVVIILLQELFHLVPMMAWV